MVRQIILIVLGSLLVLAHGKMPYFRVPASVLNSDAKFVEWARKSVEIAHG